MEKLEARVDVFRELIERSSDVTILTDLEFRIRYVSSSATHLFGQEPMALLGRSIFDFVDNKRAAVWRHHLAKLNDRKTVDISFKVPVKEEERFFDVQVSNLEDNNGVKGFMLTLHDITEKKVREQELVESNLHLDQVFYKTTHDLMAPLHSMLGLATLAETGSEEERLRYIGLIKSNILRLEGYLKEINTFFQGNRLEIKRERINIRQLVSQEIDILRGTPTARGIEIGIELDQHTDFYSDTFRMRTIVTNLCSNAIKYSDLNKKWPFVKIGVKIDSKACVLEVQDNGIGIDFESQKRIFDRFFRATDTSYGAGVGLYIVKDTVQRLGGTIEVSSIKGVGTTFAATIPNQTYQSVL
jgi:hypothetical protein